MKKNDFFYICIFVFVSIIYTFPAFWNIFNWGQMDWDQFIFWNAVPRESLLTYKQFPFWNPYVNGGNVMLAHPHSSFLSPFYLCVLIWGPLIGLKLEIFIHFISGLIGMFFLAQHLGSQKQGAFFSSVVYMMSSIYALHITEGHACWMTMAFIPWVFLFFIKSLKQKASIIGAIVSLSLILLGGGVDVFAILFLLLCVFSLFEAIRIKNSCPLVMLAVLFSGAFMLCAVKLLPMIEFLYQYPRFIYDDKGVSFTILLKMLFDRDQFVLDIVQWDWDPTENQIDMHGWHEYGAYIGIIPLCLGIYAMIKMWRSGWPLIISGFFFLIIAMGTASPVNLWAVLNVFPVYNSLTVPSRFILGFIFFISLFSGFGFCHLKEIIYRKTGSNKPAQWAFLLIIIFVCFDLWLVNSPIFFNAFRIKPEEIKRYDTFAQRYKTKNLYVKRNSRSSQYPIFLSNSGVLDGYECVNVKRGDVRTTEDESYKGEVYLESGCPAIVLRHFSPNKIVIDVDIKEKDVLILNQNYYTGWKAKKDGQKIHAEIFRGLVSTKLMPGKKRVEFYYMPFSFVLGSVISFFCFIAYILIIFKLRNEKSNV